MRDDGRIKVLNFGIARRATSERGEKDDTHAQRGVGTLTGKGVIVGTLQYVMPPGEQLGGRPIDRRADQFGWAVTAYELFAGLHLGPQSTSMRWRPSARSSPNPHPLSARSLRGSPPRSWRQ